MSNDTFGKIGVLECSFALPQQDYVSSVQSLISDLELNKVVILPKKVDNGGSGQCQVSTQDMVNMLELLFKDLDNVEVYNPTDLSGDVISAIQDENSGSKIVSINDEFNSKIKTCSNDVMWQLKNRVWNPSIPDSVYSYIVKNNLYGVKPNFDWLREKAYAMLKPKRVPHVMGCEKKAIELAKLWGADVEKAQTAAILHDITKKYTLDEHLYACSKYGIVLDEIEEKAEKLMHSKTGAAYAKYEFGVSDEISDAICYHTTGRANMTLLEQVVYMADYIEENRDFPGVEYLREAASQSNVKAMKMGLEMSVQEVTEKGYVPHSNTLEAYEYFKKLEEENVRTL